MSDNKQSDELTLGPISLTSRIILGSALYPSTQVMLNCVENSGTQLVTVSLRRVSVGDQSEPENIYSLLREKGIRILPNTAGCFTASDAIKTAQLAREALDTPLIKLEIIADRETLLPDSEQLLVAAEELSNQGFVVLPYTNDDPVLAQKLEQCGCAAVMPLASPIGTGLGIRNPHNIQLIRDRVTVPVIIDAGLGTASDIVIAFELGCDAVLLNTAIAKAGEPEHMAQAFNLAAKAGRGAFLSRRMPKQYHAKASSSWENRPWS